MHMLLALSEVIEKDMELEVNCLVTWKEKSELLKNYPRIGGSFKKN